MGATKEGRKGRGAKKKCRKREREEEERVVSERETERRRRAQQGEATNLLSVAAAAQIARTSRGDPSQRLEKLAPASSNRRAQSRCPWRREMCRAVQLWWSLSSRSSRDPTSAPCEGEIGRVSMRSPPRHRSTRSLFPKKSP